MELKAKSVKLFCSVVETGSLLSAANLNAMSTPAASRAIGQLEARIGYRLFDRSSKTLTLTEDGKAFYRVAKESVRAWSILEEFPEKSRAKKRELRIAVLARHCSDVIIPSVVRILKRHEKTLQVTMDMHQSRDIHYSKYSHPFDVGFGTLLSNHDDLQKVALAHLPFRLVVPLSNPLSSLERVSIDDYRHENFILLSADKLERHYVAGLHPELAPEQISAELSSTQVALRFVNRGVGVHITDELAAKSVSDNCRAIPLETSFTIPFFAFWPTSKKTLDIEIRECIREVAHSIEAAGLPITPEGQALYAELDTPRPSSASY